MLVECPWIQHGKFCGKKGYLILEKPRKKHITYRHRFRNKKHTDYDSNARPRGQYYRVHHYVFDNYGKRKSKFCYLGNFEGALKKLRKIHEILSKYATEKPGNDSIYNNIFFVWELRSLNDIKNDINNAERLEEFKQNPNRYAEIIFETTSSANFYLIRGDHIFQKYA